MSRLGSWLEKKVSLVSYKEPFHDFLNSVTHLLGAVFSLVGIGMLLGKGLTLKSSGIAPAIIFGLCMLLLYLSSGIYHMAKIGNIKRVGRIFDHVNIYILIAGTYTPVLCFSSDPKVYNFIWIVWGLAFLGIFFTFVFWDRLKPLHVIFYLVLGWCIVVIFKPLKASLPEAFLPWAICGGLSYTIGTIFYGIKKIPYGHAIWHLFVLGGSFFFFVGIYLFLLVPPIIG